jgi:hypothetical protein
MQLAWLSARQTLPPYIAWFSTCLLIASGAPSVDRWAQSLSMQLGSLGLIVAVAMELVIRAQQLRHGQRHQQSIERRNERKLNQIIADRTTSEELGTAVARIVTSSKGVAKAATGRRFETRYACNLPVEVVELSSENTDEQGAEQTTYAGQLLDLSSAGFGMRHEHTPDNPYVLLRIGSPNGGQTVLLGELMWCRRAKEGHCESGGRLIRVVT